MITAHILFFVVCLGDSAVQMLAASTSVRLDEQDLVRRKNVASISTSFYKMLLLTSLVILNFAAAATNDNCVTAKLLQPSADTSPVEVASTVGAATYDFPCVVGSHDSPALFYSFVGTGAKMRISTCSAETAFDTTLLLDTTGSSCENNAFCLVNDGFSKDLECDPSGKAVTGSFYSVSGNKYLLAVQGGNSVNAGTFGLSLLEYIRPENDACSKPQLISPSVHLDSVAEGSTVNATKYDFPCGTGSSESPVVFYTFQGTGSKMRISTCAPQTNFGTSILLEADGSNCEDTAFCQPSGGSAVVDVDCDPSGNAVSLELFTEQGKQYLVAVQGGSSTDVGTFGLSLLEYIPPPNDTCEKAELVVPTQDRNPVVIASTVNASVYQFPCSCGSSDSPVVFYQFVGTGGAVHISTCANETDIPTTVLVDSAFSACDSLPFCVSGTGLELDLTCDPSGKSVSGEIDTIKGQVYMIAVQGRSASDVGNFGLVVQAVGPGQKNVSVSNASSRAGSLVSLLVACVAFYYTGW
jgi:hypothetical protein